LPILCICALLLLAINEYSRWMAVILLPIVVIYPLCKRFTYWPQVVLGVAFNWGMLMAWSDTRDIVPIAAWAMWLGAVFWQVGYDSMYGYVDMRDDIKLGLRSTSLRFGDNGKLWIGGFYAATILLWLYAGWGMGLSWPYFVVIGAIGAHFIWQLALFSIDRPDRSFMLFRSNMAVGVMMVVAAL